MGMLLFVVGWQKDIIGVYYILLVCKLEPSHIWGEKRFGMDFCRRVLVPLIWTYIVSIQATTTTTTLNKFRVSFTQRQEMFWKRLRLRTDLDLTLLEAEYTKVVGDRVDTGWPKCIQVSEQSGVKDNKETNTLWTETLREGPSVRAKL